MMSDLAGATEYESPRIESTTPVQAMLTWGNKDWPGHHGGNNGGHHS